MLRGLRVGRQRHERHTRSPSPKHSYLGHLVHVDRLSESRAFLGESRLARIRVSGTPSRTLISWTRTKGPTVRSVHRPRSCPRPSVALSSASSCRRGHHRCPHFGIPLPRRPPRPWNSARRDRWGFRALRGFGAGSDPNVNSRYSAQFCPCSYHPSFFGLRSCLLPTLTRCGDHTYPASEPSARNRSCTIWCAESRSQR